MAPVRLTCLSHPATPSMRQGRFVPDDEPLDAPALAALDALGPGCFGRADCVLASPLPRAAETARRLQLAAVLEPALREARAGRWAGLRLDQVDPALASRWLSDPETAPPDGESEAALGRRVADWLAGVPQLGDHLLLVTHATVVRAVLAAALDLPAMTARRLDVAPLTVAHLSWRRGWRLQRLGVPAGVVG